MIKSKTKTEGIHSSLIAALNLLDYLLGERVHVQVLAGKVSDDEFAALEKEGGPIEELNVARAKAKLHPQDPKRNFPLVKKAFGQYLKAGNGVLVVITDGANRFKVSDPSFEETFKYLSEIHPGVKASVVESSTSFDTVFFSYNEAVQTPAVEKANSKKAEPAEKNDSPKAD